MANLPSQTFHNRRDASLHIRDPDIAQAVHDLVVDIGMEGISSDEEREDAIGGVKEYVAFDKVWRSRPFEEILRWLDRKHVEMRNPHGAPIRRRFLRPGVSRANFTVPKGLPIDCYDSTYLRSLSGAYRRVLYPEPAVDVEGLWLALVRTEVDLSEGELRD